MPDWDSRLQAALGNDTALLALLKEDASIDIKVAAVLALGDEEALKQAEREFRTHDRRVHTVAKQSYEKRIAQRKARARADELIEAAVVMTNESMIPANRLVELDQSWRALDLDLLEGEQAAEFLAVQARLAQQVRECAERQRAVSRWSADARQALAKLDACCTHVTDAARAPHDLLIALTAASAEARNVHAQTNALTPPPGTDAKTVAALGNELSAALDGSVLLEARLKILDELQEAGSSQASTPAADIAVGSATPVERWRSLAPVAETCLEDALNARFDAWQRGQDEVRLQRTAGKRQRTQQKHQHLQEARTRSLIDLMRGAEAALAAGHVAEAVKLLPALQAACDRGEVGADLHGKAAALQAEILRLKGWQHWGGGRVRDDLVAEAETLARSVAAAEGNNVAKVPVTQLEKYIEQLRGRWTELDRLGGATGKPLWQRFDAALKTAGRPVAAHKARLAEARLENLAARENLLTGLDALNSGNDAPGAGPDWKSIASAVQRFHAEWRKLGPLEHTVPHKRLAALAQRLQTSVKRLDEPLQEVFRTARAERENFVVRARDLSCRANERDIVGKLRDLQTEWQRHSRSMPLPHAVEKALWDEFKQAADAVMNARDAAIKDRNSQFEAGQKAREALLEQLQALHPDTPPAEIRRVLAEVTAAWRNCGDAGRDKAARLDIRFNELQEAARKYLAGSAGRLWNASCDCLLAKLALCGELEAGGPLAPAVVSDIEARWARLPALIPRWDKVVQARFDAGVEQARQNSSGPTATAGTIDDLLLQLESALGIPSPVAAEGARRALKLQALKNALEGRKSAAPAAVDIPRLTATTLACTHLSQNQRDRLDAVIGGLRRSGPE